MKYIKSKCVLSNIEKSQSQCEWHNNQKLISKVNVKFVREMKRKRKKVNI